MVLVGSTLNRLFITSLIVGRDELPLIPVCLLGAAGYKYIAPTELVVLLPASDQEPPSISLLAGASSFALLYSD
jgi:hypothetical protein